VPTGLEVVEAAVTLSVPTAPAVDRLYFWALQVSFPGAAGAHLGLQWGADPGRRQRHVNWGGYGPDGGELQGSASVLPSSFENPNTRDYDWQDGRAHRLRVAWERAGGGGRVDDTLVRHLAAPGGSLTGLMVWSEVFADCDHPPVSVRWSELEVITKAGERVPVRSVVTSYQTRSDGGCDNTASTVDGAAFVQTTSTTRAHPPGSRLILVDRAGPAGVAGG
jgi:hypothetical protein